MNLAERKEALSFLGLDLPEEEINSIPQDKFEEGLNKRALEMLPISDEYHPDIPLEVRASIKAFGQEGTPESLAYAKQYAPQLQWALNNNELIARGSKDPSWRKLDPSTISPSEIGRDILDLGYDIPAAAISSLPLALGPYGLPASALVGTGLEALKEKIGMNIGLQKDFSPANLTIASAAPIVPIVGSKALKAAIKPTAAVASYLSDVPQEALAAYGQEGFKQTVKGLKSSYVKMSDKLREFLHPLEEAAANAKVRAEAAIENLLHSADKYAPEGLSTKPLFKIIDSFIKSEKTAKGTTGVHASDAELAELGKSFKDRISATPTIQKAKPPETLLEKLQAVIFGVPKDVEVPATSTNLSASQARALQKELEDISKPFASPGKSPSGKGVSTQREFVLAQKLSTELKAMQDRMWDKVPLPEREKLGYSALADARKGYATAKTQADIVGALAGKKSQPMVRFTRGYKTAQQASEPDGPISHQVLQSVAHDLGVTIPQGPLNELMAASSIEAAPKFSLPGARILATGGTTAAIGGKMGGIPGALTGAAMGTTADVLGSSPFVMSRLIEKMGQGSRLLGTKKASTAGSLLGAQFTSEE